MLGRALVLVMSWVALPGHSVRLKQAPQAPDEGGGAAAVEPPVNPPAEPKSGSEDAECSDGSARSLPAFKLFERYWHRFKKAEESGANSQQALSSQNEGAAPIRMVVGVFTTSSKKDKPYREVIRKSWWRQPGVCVLDSAAPTADCSVYVTFVVGNNGEDTGEENVIILPIPENMNHGKTRVWFHHASRSYTWATHIAKMDMDTYPHLPYMLYWTREQQSKFSCSNVFGGRQFTCRADWCAPAHCGYCPGSDFMKFAVNDTRCWSYMQGGFYFLSRALAEGASVDGGFWDKESQRCHAEDAVTGHAVHEFASQQKMCVHIVNLSTTDAFWHSAVDPRHPPELSPED